MTTIAVISDDGRTVSQHFGRARYYVVLTVENGQGSMHKACFRLATLVWQIAFDTRALSPRR
jgi:hypothetical protein